MWLFQRNGPAAPFPRLLAAAAVLALLTPAMAAGPSATARISIERIDPSLDTPRHEFGDASSDHEAVVLAIARCHPEAGDPLTWPASVRSVFRLGLTPELTHVQAGAGRDGPGPSLQLTPFQAEAVLFSDEISRQRLRYAMDLDRNRSRAARYFFWIVAAGGFVTLLVGVQSLAGKTLPNPYAIALGAVVIAVSALATSLGSLSNYETGFTQPLNQERALAQLKQLHARIAADVNRKTTLCDRPGKDEKKEAKTLAVVDAWGARLEKILNDAVPNVAQPGDLASPAPPPQEGPGFSFPGRVASVSR